MTRAKTTVFATMTLTERREASEGTQDSAGPHAGDPAADRISSVQLLRSGTFEHGWYGKIQIDAALYDALIRNFADRVRGIDIALDVEHQPASGAAGWFRRLYTSEDGEQLWGLVEWTPKGRALVQEGLFKYISIEYDLAYVDETGALHGPTMLGAALTNRPFIKNMREATLHLSEDAAQGASMIEKVDEKHDGVGPSGREATLLSEVRALREERRRLREELRRIKLDHMLTEGKRAGKVTPAMERWLRELAEKDDPAGSDFPMVRRAIASLPVQLDFSEIGTTADGTFDADGEVPADPIAALDRAVSEKMRTLADEDPARSIRYADALALVQREQPGLVAAYRRATRG